MKLHTSATFTTTALIGGVLWLIVAGCSSNPVNDAAIDVLEYDNLTITANGFSWNGGSVYVTDTGATAHECVQRTWQLLDALSHDEMPADSVSYPIEQISAMRKQIRRGHLAQPYLWPSVDNSSQWIINAYHLYSLTHDREWLSQAYTTGVTAMDRLWTVNFTPEHGLLRGESETTGITAGIYPQWMRLTDKLSVIHLSTNTLAIAALKALSIMADSLELNRPELAMRADTLTRNINRKMWSPATGTYARCLYSTPFPMANTELDIISNLLAITSGTVPADVTGYVCSQLTAHGTKYLQGIPLSPSVKWIGPRTAELGINDDNVTLHVYENGLLTGYIDHTATKYTVTDSSSLAIIAFVPTSADGINGFARRPHRVTPNGFITDIEAENIGTPGTRLIRQNKMARRFIELTRAKNSRIHFTVTVRDTCTYCMEMIYTDGTSTQPWQLRQITVNGRHCGIAAMPRLYAGPSTRGISTTVTLPLSQGTNHVTVEPTPALPPRGSILLDKIRLTLITSRP